MSTRFFYTSVCGTQTEIYVVLCATDRGEKIKAVRRGK